MTTAPDNRLLFFASVDGSAVHQRFVFPFIASALITHPDSFCEVAVPSLGDFIRAFPAELGPLSWLTSHEARGRFRIREWDWRLQRPKFRSQPCSGSLVRFLERPILLNVYGAEWIPYTYLCDIDILFIKNILPTHLEVMEATGYPYTNIRRPGNCARVTGCMMVRNDIYYPAMLPIMESYIGNPETLYYPIRNDEEMLFRLINESALPTPDPRWGANMRPIEFIHTSHNRKIDRSVRKGVEVPGWECVPWKMELARDLFATTEWGEMYLPDEYREDFLKPIEERMRQLEEPKWIQRLEK